MKTSALKTFTTGLSALAVMACLAMPASADILVQTSEDTWETDVDNGVSSTALSGSASTGVQDIPVSVDQYSGNMDLTRVIITYIQPNPPTSPTIDGTVSLQDEVSGNTFFNSVSLTTETTIDSGNLNIDLFTIGVTPPIDNDAVASDSDEVLNQGISGSQDIDFQVGLSYTEVYFDSDDYALTGSLNDIFAGNGTIDFTVATDMIAQFDRTTADQINFNYTGTDSGIIRIQYFVPEPTSAAMLIGAGSLLLLRRRRR